MTVGWTDRWIGREMDEQSDGWTVRWLDIQMD